MQPLLQWKTMSITQTVCIFLVLNIQHAMRIRNIVIFGLPRCTVFSMLPHKGHDFREKN